MTKERAFKILDGTSLCRGCDVTTDWSCDECQEAFLMALKALKQQEAKPVVCEERRVIDDETDDGVIYGKDLFYHCPSCNLILSRTHKDKDIHFCYCCGQGVSWDA